MSVSAFPYGTIQYGQGFGLFTKCTLGTLVDLVTTGGHPSTVYWDGFGYDGGADYYSYGTNVGSLGEDTYIDAGSNSRTVASIIWAEGTEFVLFSLDGTSIPDTDTTFVELKVRNTIYTRASRDGYTASRNGGTHWWWPDATNPWESESGTRIFEVRT